MRKLLPGLPKKKEIMAQRVKMNEFIEMEDLLDSHGNVVGSIRDVGKLLEKHLSLRKYEGIIKWHLDNNKPLLVRATSDGRRVARNGRQSVNVAIRFVWHGSQQSSDEEISIAIYEEGESYESAERYLKRVLEALDDATKDGIQFGDRTLEFYVIACMDWKMLMYWMGVTFAASQDYFCLLCYTTKEMWRSNDPEALPDPAASLMAEISDAAHVRESEMFPVSEDGYILRTKRNTDAVAAATEHERTHRGKLGQVTKSIIPASWEFDRIFMDLLHMLLRFGDRVFKLPLAKLCQGGAKQPKLDALKVAVAACGIKSWSYWFKKAEIVRAQDASAECEGI